jgi:capsular exopolysaccharide synthesis family protein
VLDRAELPDAPVDSNPLRNGLLALAVGGVLAIAGALLLEYLDDSWRSLEEAARISGVPTFALIPAAGFQNKAKTNDSTLRLVTIHEPHGASAEAYRTLSTTLLHAFADVPPKVVVLTSHGAGEGKTTTCANLGVALVQAGKSVLVLDCDFRNPSLHTIFGFPNLFGIVDVVAGERSVQDVWHEPVEGLKVVSASPESIDPTRFLRSERFAKVLADVRGKYDHVLLSAPPVGLVSDPAILAAQSDGVLLVLDAQKTRKVAVQQSVRRLEAVGANVIGTVLSNFRFIECQRRSLI